MAEVKYKSVSMKIHAKKRFKERTSLELTEQLAKKIVFKIKTGKLKLLKRQSNRVTVWLYTIGDKDYKLYYDSNRHLIITILPIRWMKDWLKGKVNLV